MPKSAWSTAIEPHAHALIGKLFERIEGAVGNKAAALYEGATAEIVQAEWAEALAGFSDVEIMRGLAEVRKRPFAPNAGEFARLCRPALDPEYAWHEAGECLRQRDTLIGGKPQAGDWSHPAVYRAANRMAQEVRGGDYRAHRVRWGFVLAREFAAGWGEPIEPPPLKIESKPKLGPPPVAVREQMALILNAPKVAAALRKRAGKTEIDPAEAARCERLAAINWKASTPDQRVAEFGEAFRNVEIAEVVPGAPIALVVNLSGRRAMLCGDDLQATLSETIAARTAAAQAE